MRKTDWTMAISWLFLGVAGVSYCLYVIETGTAWVALLTMLSIFLAWLFLRAIRRTKWLSWVMLGGIGLLYLIGVIYTEQAKAAGIGMVAAFVGLFLLPWSINRLARRRREP